MVTSRFSKWNAHCSDSTHSIVQVFVQWLGRWLMHNMCRVQISIRNGYMKCVRFQFKGAPGLYSRCGQKMTKAPPTNQTTSHYVVNFSEYKENIQKIELRFFLLLFEYLYKHFIQISLIKKKCLLFLSCKFLKYPIINIKQPYREYPLLNFLHILAFHDSYTNS